MSGTVETELGVPIPGIILPEDQWARTAVKRLPPPGPLDLVQLFGRDAPLVVDLGCGNGRFTLWNASQHPEWNHLAVDILPVVIRYATRRANQRGLGNVRIAVIGGLELLRDYLAPVSTWQIHCYHPQPYYDPREIHKRLVTPEFLALVHSRLAPGGQFFLQTDNPAYARYMQSIVGHFFEMQVLPDRWPDTPEGRTRREIIALRERLPVYRAVGVRREDVSEREYEGLIRMLPRPTFDADRRLARYDRLERETESRPSASRPKRSGPPRPPRGTSKR